MSGEGIKYLYPIESLQELLMGGKTAETKDRVLLAFSDTPTPQIPYRIAS
jgi:hypothetical protein